MNFGGSFYTNICCQSLRSYTVVSLVYVCHWRGGNERIIVGFLKKILVIRYELDVFSPDRMARIQQQLVNGSSVRIHCFSTIRGSP